MALRLILVGLVTSLGLDLPEGQDLEGWVGSGRTWWEARVSEFEARRQVGTEALAEVHATATPHAEDEPMSLAAVVNEVVEAYQSEQEAQDSAVEDSSSVAANDDDLYPGLAYALNRWADGLSDPDDLKIDLAAADNAVGDLLQLAAEASEPVPAPEADQPDAGELRLGSKSTTGAADLAVEPGEGPADPLSGACTERFTVAISLTGQALQAWMSLLHPTDPVASPSL